MTHAFFRGPLPPPALLEHYERVAPGAAERILGLAEEQFRGRNRLETEVVQASIRSETRGQWFAFLTVLGGMTLGALLIRSGHDVGGLVSMLTPLTIAAGLFVHSRHAMARERERRRLELERVRREVGRLRHGPSG